MNSLLREQADEEEFDIDDLIVLQPKKSKPQKGEGGGEGEEGDEEEEGEGGGEGEEGDEGIDDEAAEELDRQSGDDHSGHGEAGDEEGEGEDGEPKDSQGNPIDQEDLEQHSKRTSSKAGKQQDQPGEGGDQGDGQPKKPGAGGRGASGATAPRAVDWKGMKPRYDWKTLLTRLVRSSNTMEVTYQKVHRRNITSVHVAADVGAGVIRPGEKEVESNLVKLCIVVDSSGSMHDAIKTVLSNVQKLLTENSASVAKSFAFVEFSSNYHMYLCTYSGRNGTAVPIKSVKDIGAKSPLKPETIESLLTRHQGGATNFTSALTAELSAFAAQKYNILIMTDTDIMGSGNKEEFLDLYAKHHSQVYLILDSRDSWLKVVQAMKSASANISHM